MQVALYLRLGTVAKTMQAQEIAILRQDNVLLEGVTEYFAQLFEVSRASYPVRESLFLGLGPRWSDNQVEYRFGTVIEPLYDGLGKERDDKRKEGLRDNDNEAEDNSRIFTAAQASYKRDTRHLKGQ